MKSWSFAGKMGYSVSMIAAGAAVRVEATKRVQAVTGPGLKEAVSRPLRILTPNPSKEVKPI
ncbi:hypothetical protein [Thalassovita sp.]|uniref:hypothetical protein n=1 Tax=Thalassovita sp. TaxID=1979401 RepID=UPI002AB0D3AC|nr:hypothetical protein [Thalassovita sp.]